MSADLRGELIANLSQQGAWCGCCDFDGDCSECDRVLGQYADAILPIIERHTAALAAERDRARDLAQRLEGWSPMADNDVARLRFPFAGTLFGALVDTLEAAYGSGLTTRQDGEWHVVSRPEEAPE
jgi:hypothetical protein